MSKSHGIVYSRDAKIIALCEGFGAKSKVGWCSEQNMADFFLKLSENDFKVILFDCSESDADCLKWVRLLRTLRPRIPLVILCKQCTRERGAKLLEQGVFYLCQHPVNENVLTEVLSSAIKLCNKNKEVMRHQ